MSAHISRRTLLQGSALGLGFVGLGGLAGCSNSGPSTTTSGSGEPPTYIEYTGIEPDLPSTDASVPAAFFKYPDDPVKAFTDAPGDGDPVTLMAQSSEPIPPAMDRNEYWQELNRRVGSEFQIAITPATDYGAKFATVMTGNELPDIFQVARGANSVPQMLQAKATDLSEYLAGDAIEQYPMLANIPTVSWSHGMLNGKIMAVPIPRGVLQATIIYRREDLLRDAGVDAQPENFTELFDLAKDLTSPRNNVWAFTAAPYNYIQQMLKVPNGWRLEDDGSLIYGGEVAEVKDALDATRQMIAADVVVPDSFAGNGGQYKQWFMAGTAFFTGDSYSAWPAYHALGSADGFELSAMDMVGFDGGRGQIWLRSPTHSIVAINKDSSDRVETLLSIMNWLAAPFGTEEYLFRKYGVEGVHFDWADGDPERIPAKQGEIYMGQQYIADAPPVLYLPGGADVVQNQYDQMTAVIPEGVWDPTDGLYSETDQRKGGQLSKSLDSVRDEILQSRRPVSDWDQAIEDWRTGGGDDIREEYLQLLAEA